MTGSPYSIQRYEEGVWVSLEMPENTAWTTEAYEIPSNSALRWRIDWEDIYGSLAPGKYRIGKTFTDFRATADYDAATFYAEFEITD